MRNVLLITADQWRADSLSAVGHPLVRTPHLDRLAAEGVLFRRHYAQATPCAPSRASLHTGLYQHNHRLVVNGAVLDRRHANVALEARKMGYRPGFLGYTDVAADPRVLAPGDPELRRSDGILPGMEPLLRMDNEQSQWCAFLRDRGYALGEDPEAPFRPAADATYGDGPLPPALYEAEHSLSGFLVDGTIEQLKKQKDRPWFLHLSIYPPHPPFIAAAPFNGLTDPAAVDLPARRATPEEEARQHPYLGYYLWHQQGNRMWPAWPEEDRLAFSDLQVRQLRAAYYGLISEVDAQLGRLMAFLKERGLYDETLIVFTSDHGEQLGEHWMFAKYSYFEPTYAIPLIVRDPRPGGARGRVVEDFSESVDIMPTILEWIGAPIPPQCDGRSLVPYLQGDVPSAPRAEVHWSFDFRDLAEKAGRPVLGLTPETSSMMGMRDERYKYVHFAGLPPVFFDLQEDPDEFHNLAGDPAHAARVMDYAQRLLSWRMARDDRTLSHLRITESGLVDVMASGS
ncbi:MAG: alkaline phosphatase family protein [Pseudomonadota bacterium]